LQEKWFSFLHNVGFKNEQGQDEYTAEGKFFHLGLDMYLKHQGTTICEIKSKIFSLAAEYDFYQSGTQVGKIRKEIHLFTEKWLFTDMKKNTQWHLTGDFLNYDWKVTSMDGTQTCAEISRRHSFIKDAYGVAIEPGADLSLILCVAVCMEKYHHDHRLFH